MNFVGILVAVLAIDAPFGAFEIAETKFPERNFAIVEFGAKVDGTKCTEAFAAAMAACEQAGGGHCRHPLRLERRAQEERFCLALQIIGRSGETPLPQGVHRPCVRLCRHNDLSSLGDRRGAGPFA